jgi:hypothetical protein
MYPRGKVILVLLNYYDKLKRLSMTFNSFTYFRSHLLYFKPDTLRFLLEQVGFIDVKIVGTQLYSLENAIHWIRAGAPFLEYGQIEMPMGWNGLAITINAPLRKIWFPMI